MVPLEVLFFATLLDGRMFTTLDEGTFTTLDGEIFVTLDEGVTVDEEVTLWGDSLLEW